MHALQVTEGAKTLGWSLRRYLTALKEAGLGSLPGTAAEVLDDETRAIICPDKLNTAQWLEVCYGAHCLCQRLSDDFACSLASEVAIGLELPEACACDSILSFSWTCMSMSTALGQAQESDLIVSLRSRSCSSPA